jgi:hypothetical protein
LRWRDAGPAPAFRNLDYASQAEFRRANLLSDGRTAAGRVQLILVDSDEVEICRYLESCRGQFVSAVEISRRAASRKRFQEEPKWATSALHRLMDNGEIETNGKGQYRLRPKQTEEKPKVKRWISPHIQKILRDSGKHFDAMDPGPPESEE